MKNKSQTEQATAKPGVLEKLRDKLKTGNKVMIVVVILLLLLFLATLTVTAVYLIEQRFSLPMQRTEMHTPVIQQIPLPAEETAKPIPNVEVGYFTVEVDSDARIENGKLRTRVANPYGNSNPCKVDFVVGDTTLYSSEAVSPGQMMESIPLSAEVIPDLGEYTMAVIYHVLSEEGDPLAEYVVDVTLSVRG